ncbi:MAG: type IV pilus twitching motility protein PilT [bacterium]|nr:type IV pilus twitching motility protein PilT [bacterium]
MASASSMPLDGFLSELMDLGGTDLHITAGSPPLVRVDGDLRRLGNHPSVTPDAVRDLIHDVLPPDLEAKYLAAKTLDLSFNWQNEARFRVNLFFQRGSMALALRLIPYDIPTFEQLGLPAVCSDLVHLHQGLVLLTGPTGSGKSTTVAAMIGWINANRPVHVLTIEDPLEYVHRHDVGIVNQRELGEDAESFPDALRSALREDPDVLLIGEMRDLETIQTVLTIAETGHLVFATLHTNDTAQAVDRIVDVFPEGRQTQVRVQLAGVLESVIYQRLVPKVGGGRVAAFEVLVANNPIRNLIREGRTRQMRNVIATSQRDGMQTLEADLNDLIQRGLITREDAVSRSGYPKEIAAPGF